MFTLVFAFIFLVNFSYFTSFTWQQIEYLFPLQAVTNPTVILKAGGSNSCGELRLQPTLREIRV